jgi:carboxymethylenebutenolidase
MSYRAITAETIPFTGHNGDRGEAYYARPNAPGKYPGVVLIHHLPGWDEWTTEATRKLAHNGFATLCPHLYFREGSDSPAEIGARVRAAGGVADAQVMGDAAAALAFLKSQSNSNGKIAVMGFCSGGRHAYLAACTIPGFDALVDCWGGNVIVDDPKALNEKRPVAPIELTEKLRIPVLGLFGNEDGNPTPDQVNRTEAILKQLGKTYEFHRYDGVGHAFFNYERPGYKPEPMVEGWKKVFAFLNRHVSASP